ncbi:MAG: hypothetical protein K6G85_02555 [Eubacterium sp.]|nr:hypothetical protein [Eubacterium sp.]
MKKNILKGIGVFAVVAFVGIASVQTTEAKTLKENKTYKINLDQKKGKEKIQIKSRKAKTGDYRVFTLYINGKKAAKQTGNDIKCRVVDIDKKVKGKDIIFYATTESQCLAHNAGIYSYKKGKCKRILNMNNQYFRIDKIYCNGRGRVIVEADTPVDIGICCYYGNIAYKMQSGKLVRKTYGDFLFSKTTQNMKYELNEKTKLYSDPDKTKESKVTLKKNTEIQLVRAKYNTEGCGYLYVIAKDGTSGWMAIRPMSYEEIDHNQFKSYPTWG